MQRLCRGESSTAMIGRRIARCQRPTKADTLAARAILASGSDAAEANALKRSLRQQLVARDHGHDQAARRIDHHDAVVELHEFVAARAESPASRWRANPASPR